MKTFNEYKEEVAVKHGYLGWNEFLFDNWLHDEEMNAVIDEAAELYAEEVAKAQRNACYDSLTIEHMTTRNRILSTPLVTDK